MKPATGIFRKFFLEPKLRIALGLALGAGLGITMARNMEWSSLSTAFKDFPLRYCVISLSVFSAATAIRAYRWQVLFIGGKIPLHRLLLVQNVGIGLNSVSPLKIISEATQFLMLTLRYQARSEEVAATLGMQRVLDFVIAAVLLSVGLMFLPSLEGFTPYVVCAILIAVVSVLAVPAVIWFGSRPGLTHLKLLASTSSSLRELARARVRLTWSFMLTVGYWILLGLSVWVLAYGMQIDISLMAAILLVIGTLTFVALVPSLPASVGTFEFVVFYLLTTIGVEDGKALGFALVIHSILFMPPILIAAIVFIAWAIKGKRKPTRLAPDLVSSDSLQPHAPSR